MVGRESCRVGLLSTVENPWVLLAASVLKRQTDLRASCPSPARSGMQGKPLSHAGQCKGGPCLPAWDVLCLERPVVPRFCLCWALLSPSGMWFGIS